MRIKNNSASEQLLDENPFYLSFNLKWNWVGETVFRNLAFSKEHYAIVEILAKEPPSQVMKLVPVGNSP